MKFPSIWKTVLSIVVLSLVTLSADAQIWLTKEYWLTSQSPIKWIPLSPNTVVTNAGETFGDFGTPKVLQTSVRRLDGGNTEASFYLPALGPTNSGYLENPGEICLTGEFDPVSGSGSVTIKLTSGGVAQVRVAFYCDLPGFQFPCEFSGPGVTTHNVGLSPGQSFSHPPALLGSIEASPDLTVVGTIDGIGTIYTDWRKKWLFRREVGYAPRPIGTQVYTNTTGGFVWFTLRTWFE